MSPGQPPAYRDLSRRQRRVVRRAARRGRRAQFPPELAAPLLAFADRRKRRAARVLAVAVAVILVSVAATVAVFLRAGADPLLAAPAVGLLVGGLVGVRSESRLRRAEQAADLAAQQLERRAGAPPPAGVAAAPPASAEDAARGAPAGDAAQQRLARILSGADVVAPRDPAVGGRHPWD